MMKRRGKIRTHSQTVVSIPRPLREQVIAEREHRQQRCAEAIRAALTDCRCELGAVRTERSHGTAGIEWTFYPVALD